MFDRDIFSIKKILFYYSSIHDSKNMNLVFGEIFSYDLLLPTPSPRNTSKKYNFSATKHVKLAPQLISWPNSDFLCFGWANSTSPLSESCFYFSPAFFTINFWSLILIKTPTSCLPKLSSLPFMSLGSRRSETDKQYNSAGTHTVCF